MKKRPLVLPYDGYLDSAVLLSDLEADLKKPGIVELLSYIKINDAVFSYMMSAPFLVCEVWRLIVKYKLDKTVDIFLDLKSADTSGTVRNIAKHFGIAFAGILTLRSNLSGQGYKEIRNMLPNAKVAIVSFLTDNSEQDCLEQYGMFPEEKILHDMRIVQRKYDRVRQINDPAFAFDMIVCSPREVAYIQLNEMPIFGRRFEKITPGIRDKWMSKGQQNRIAGAATAMKNGADYLVMGAQMRTGNPDNGVTAEDSQARTAFEIKKSLAEEK